MEEPEETSNPLDLIEFADGLPIPPQVKKNAIKALASGIAGLITATLDVPTAYFERLAAVIRARGEGEVAITKVAATAAGESFQANPELRERALQYFSSKIISEQTNREKTARKALQYLEGESNSSDAKQGIDEDWLVAFWRLAETKSKEEVQDLLARLLAREIVAPGSISPHTLQVLSILTTGLGQKFAHFCRLSIDDGTSVFVIHPSVFAFQNIGPLHDYGIDYNNLFELDGAGLIRSAETLLIQYKEDDSAEPEIVDYAGQKVMLNVAGKQVNLLQMTLAGKELRRLLVLEPIPVYTEKLQQILGDSFILLAQDGRTEPST